RPAHARPLLGPRRPRDPRHLPRPRHPLLRPRPPRRRPLDDDRRRASPARVRRSLRGRGGPPGPELLGAAPRGPGWSARFSARWRNSRRRRQLDWALFPCGKETLMYDVDERDEVVALEGVPQSSAGAPIPVVLADEHRVVLAYYVEEPTP